MLAHVTLAVIVEPASFVTPSAGAAIEPVGGST
jgi:hypothetical protein